MLNPIQIDLNPNIIGYNSVIHFHSLLAQHFLSSILFIYATLNIFQCQMPFSYETFQYTMTTSTSTLAMGPNCLGSMKIHM